MRCHACRQVARAQRAWPRLPARSSPRNALAGVQRRARPRRGRSSKRRAGPRWSGARPAMRRSGEARVHGLPALSRMLAIGGAQPFGTSLACPRFPVGTPTSRPRIIKNGHHRAPRLRRQEQGVRPASVGRPAAADPRPRRLRRINLPPMEHEHVHALVYDIMTDTQRKHYEDYARSATSASRCRASRAFASTRSTSSAARRAVFRTIPSKVLRSRSSTRRRSSRR